MYIIVKYIHYMAPPDPAATLDRLLAVTDALGRDMADSFTRSGLTGPRTHLLWVLAAQGPTTQRDLATALSVTPRNITGLVDRLVDTGFVTREAHATDRRISLVTLTELGRSTTAQLAADHADLARSLFGDLPPRTLAAFDAGLGQVLARLQELLGRGSS